MKVKEIIFYDLIENMEINNVLILEIKDSEHMIV